MKPHGRKKKAPVDMFPPIIADGDTGHGGLTAVMKLTKVNSPYSTNAMQLQAVNAGGHKEEGPMNGTNGKQHHAPGRAYSVCACINTQCLCEQVQDLKRPHAPDSAIAPYL